LIDPLKRTPLLGSVFALALTALALLVSFVLRPYLEPNLFLLFVAAVWLSAWYHGRTGGLTAAAAGAVASFFFFMRQDIALDGWWRISARLGAFLLLAVLITWVTASWRESRQLLSSTLSSIADAVLVTNEDGRVTFMNAVAETLTGWPVDEARGKPAREVLRLISGATREPLEDPLARALRERATVAGPQDAVLIARSGVEVPVEQDAAPVRGDAGELCGGILVFRDISKRLQLEEQATHAQKMDAVGRLAGGVAGDFNNVLTVITGYAELLRSELPPSGPLRRFVDEIVYGGERAAALTRHLLAFSGGTTAQPRVLDLSGVVAGMQPMLHRLLGDNIELIVLSSVGLGRVRADASQVEQIIVNLATNSREAMPAGGKLVIETANVDLADEGAGRNFGVKPGSYVMLAVSDTGTGMEPETRSRLFEPFFTTKEPGKGSGLGLATAYGAIKQSDGQVTVFSQPGCGTIFEIYLPRLQDVPAEEARKSLARGSETILLVDDEEGVRKLVHAVLQANGYDVLEAPSGAAALAAYEKNSHKIDMVLTDVVMPQMSGFELVRQLCGRAPALKILFMSGYRDNAPQGAGVDEAQRSFLHKPFTPAALLAKVREVLDREPA
jgi:two-component system cell cycle sensor histidine kinase/response regulator CckA